MIEGPTCMGTGKIDFMGSIELQKFSPARGRHNNVFRTATFS